MKFETPILFLTWKRLEITKKVFVIIKKIKPTKLYISSDGHRQEVKGEDIKVQETRDFLMSNIDWECDVKTLFYEKNNGCRKAVSRAISWFFENEDEGIILEDDCLPSLEFFPFCQELLKKYRFDERIWCVSGNNFQNNIIRGDGSYYFSRYNHCWGWASWKRCWRKYDSNLNSWPFLKSYSHLENIFDNNRQKKYWQKIWDKLYLHDKPDSWAYRWTYSCMVNSGLTLLPNKNLVTNIGFGEDSTHTKEKKQNIPKLDNDLRDYFVNIKHPKFVLRDKKADFYTEENYFSGPKIFSFLFLNKIFMRLFFILNFKK